MKLYIAAIKRTLLATAWVKNNISRQKTFFPRYIENEMLCRYHFSMLDSDSDDENTYIAAEIIFDAIFQNCIILSLSFSGFIIFKLKNFKYGLKRTFQYDIMILAK